ncbi:NFACT RNA binding domain-containing protein [Spirochaeta thermophila]|uniref:Fibronectin-binding protein n=1 Tax=Winmispira thermophila (strain ATCC 49972 / DSM 6192 / RI 19.B1) TaxID=665571 RepID=E0RPB6_WINT6|nr:NFACT family protein [Spirochaeta thermophila]ADN01310.1 fibronectin-binding protein [Spirochaeta thermophila DSM 6192]
MSFNWKEVDYALKALSLRGALVQDIFQPDFMHLGLKLYLPGRPFTLLFRMDQSGVAFFPLTTKLPRLPHPQRFTQFLRAHIRGGKITGAYQVGRERLIRIAVAREGTTTLVWIRLWATAPNIIVTDQEMTILDCMFRRPRRGEVSGERFDPWPQLMRTYEDEDPRFSVRFLDETSSSEEWFSRMEASYLETDRGARVEKLRVDLARLLERRITTLRATLTELTSRRERIRDAERYKEYGDLIITNLWQISRGQKWIEVEDYFRGGTVRIPLDPALGPQENAERYYREHRRLLQQEQNLAARMEEVSRDLTHHERLLEQIPSMGEEALEALSRTFQKEARVREKDTEVPGLHVLSQGFLIIVGRNAKESDEVLRHHARGNDLWLHVRDWPGGHVIIRSQKGKEIPHPVILDAAQLAIHFSKAKHEEVVDLYCTHVKYLRRAKHGTLGTVIPTREKNITVRRDPARISSLLQREEAQEEPPST